MKKYFSLTCLLTILFSGCNQEELLNNQSTTSESRTFTASFDQNESRTYVEEGNLLRWTKGDQISLFVESTLNSQYQFDGETGDNAGTFSPVSQSFETGNDLTAHYAVYPYASSIKISDSGIISATLPAEQSYAENSFGVGDNTMVAVTQNTNDMFLKFKNVGGYLKLQLYGDDVTIKSITLKGNNKEKLAGKASITPVYGEDPTISMAEDATETITYNCGDGVKIGSTKETATAFWIVVPPTTFEKGFTITIMDINGFEFTKSTSNEISINRNVIKPMSAIKVEPVEENKIPYITFTADAAQTFSMSQAVETLEYSVNGGEWMELGTSVVDFGGELGELRLRGKSLNGTANPPVSNPETECAHVLFGNGTSVRCSGDIRTLVDYDNYGNVDTSKASFCFLFLGCDNLATAPELPAIALAESCYLGMFAYTGLTTAPKLPATILTENCYSNMFIGCASLTTAPELPATKVNNYSYKSMFYGCIGLTTAPKLPATNLADFCYQSMFQECTNLETAPELPATILTKGCYESIFKNCIRLTTAPKLPATTLAMVCYDEMFWGCTSLMNAPELPATTLADGCYESMFYGCTSLLSAPQLPATTLTRFCYNEMFRNCTSLTTAPELPATTLTDKCYQAMFSFCTSLTNSPELPATVLAESCYFEMFSDCTNLKSAPELPATILAENCYGNMFWGCTSLTSAPELPATILADFCYKYMFQGCSSLTTPPNLPATTLTTECYYGMFYCCKNLTTSPVLIATTLAESCYSEMFINCEKVNEITMLATDISAPNSLYEWLNGVAPTGTFTKAAEMNNIPKGDSGIPSGWAVRNYGEEITAVDLGLSVKWGSCNLGANSNFDTGDRYAWGETSLKQEYTRENYAFYDVATGTYTNIGHEISGTEYDAASATLDNGWRMPTYEEWEELKNNCTTVPYTDSSGFYYAFISNINNNVIYLPATYSFSNYWTSTAKVNELGNISGYYSFYLNAGYTEFQSVNWPYQGYYIRPVYDIE